MARFCWAGATITRVIRVCGVVAAFVAVLPTVSLRGQSAAAASESWRLPRTADGHADFEGVWNASTLTPLQRPARFDGRAFMSEAEAAAFEKEQLAAQRSAPAAAFLAELWFERGTLARIDGRYPTSLIVEPADGQLPALTPAARASAARVASARSFNSSTNFSLSERCLRSASGPPYLAGTPDSNLLRIVQSRDHVALVQEKFHETRLVPLTGSPALSPAIRGWVGVSRGRWEAETLVVETTNFTPQLALANRFDEHLRLVERFTRVGANTLLYEFTVHNPTFFTAPWTVRLPMTRTDEELYEFACHEGNYSLPNILRAARAEEAAQIARPPEPSGTLDAAVAQAWTGAGAEVGWLAPDVRPAFAMNENWVYTETRPDVSTALPAFRFTALARGGLANLPEPKVPFAIVLDSAPIADDALDGAGRFANLHALYLSRTPVTDAALSADRLPTSLRVLYLGATKVTDAGVRQLGRLQQLHTLRLSGTAVTDAGLRDVARLRRLQWLNLESTRIDDEGIKELLGLTELRILHIGRTQVTDAGLQDVARLASLQVVRIGGSNVSPEGAAAVRRTRPSLSVLSPPDGAALRR
jgi:hypothetical protein